MSICYYFSLFMKMATKGAQAALKHKATMDRIKDVWKSCATVKFMEAQRVTTPEIVTALADLEWEEEYLIPGKNTHVIILLLFIETETNIYI